MPVTVSLDSLDEDALVRILKEPKNSLIRQYQALFELDGVELMFDEDAVKAIAEKTLKRKTGARGLRAIVEKVLMDLMYRVPSDTSITRQSQAAGLPRPWLRRMKPWRSYTMAARVNLPEEIIYE